MKLEPINYNDPEAARKFAKSLHETGFGVLVDHPLRQSLVDKIYADWLAFYRTEEKHAFAFSPEDQDGYYSTAISETAKGSTKKDLKEYYHVYPWGRIPDHLRADVIEYHEQAFNLARQLLGWVEAYSPPDLAARYSEPLSQMIEDSKRILLRVLRYPPLTGGEEPGAVRAAAHTDINLLTILPAANTSGLQVQLKDGTWLDVPCDFGVLIVNIGDMLQEASGGYYPSTVHRVINPTGEAARTSRLSLPLFIHPRDEVVLSDRYTSGAYLNERLKELGVKA